MPKSQGYTGVKAWAGRYSYEEAKSRCHDDDETVTMIREDEAPLFSASCYADVAQKWASEEIGRLSALLTAATERAEKLKRWHRIACKDAEEWGARATAAEAALAKAGAESGRLIGALVEARRSGQKKHRRAQKAEAMIARQAQNVTVGRKLVRYALGTAERDRAKMRAANHEARIAKAQRGKQERRAEKAEAALAEREGEVAIPEGWEASNPIYTRSPWRVVHSYPSGWVFGRDLKGYNSTAWERGSFQTPQEAMRAADEAALAPDAEKGDRDA